MTTVTPAFGHNTDIQLAPGERGIVLAGGCFWGTEAYLKKLPGVRRTFTAYVNGQGLDPDYRLVCTGATDHVEAVFVAYDPRRIDLAHLLHYFFLTFDPTQKNRQGNDVGRQYRSGIYYLDASDLPQIEAAVAKVQSGYRKPVMTEVLSLANITKAEEYHQDYLLKNPGGYCHVSFGSLPPADAVLVNAPAPGAGGPGIEGEGTGAGADEGAGHGGEGEGEGDPAHDDGGAIWQKPSDKELKAMLPPLSYEVTQHEHTERPYSSVLDQEWGDGIYVDIVSGEPLFSSRDKYDAGCGWPSFSKPLTSRRLREKVDYHTGYARTEVRSEVADSHLGHVFTDGPSELGGLRYCINGAALRFIPRERMAEEGYEDYLDEV